MMATPIVPSDGMVIHADTSLQAGTYLLPKGISIEADGVTLDGGGALIVGADRAGVGIRVNGHKGVSIRNLRLRDYYHGIHASQCDGLSIAGCQVASTAEVAPNTIFLDIWLNAQNAYGAGILLDRCRVTSVTQNDIQHQQNGLLSYHCSELDVSGNFVNYNSGYGIHLFNTCDSRFTGNAADSCCRFEPREGGQHHGHMGADATGFLIVHASCRNVFRRNTARLGGDGFFLAGLTPDGRQVGCDDNTFEENDASLSPNIAFEATFSRGNIFRRNFADRCNYGFWLGFSRDNTIENNRMVMNRQAGIAVENGRRMIVRGNSFQANGHGMLLWSKHVEQFAKAFAENLTSRDWTIEENVFTRNGKGIRIAADQDHGIRPMPEADCGRVETRPQGHAIRKNDIQDNRVGIELFKADGTIVEGNVLNRNVEANLRQEDCEGTIARNNMGSAGGYL